MIEIKYVLDEKTAIKSAYDIYRYELKNSNKKFIGLFFIALMQFGVVGALKHNVYGFLVISTIGVLYWYVFRWPLRRFFIKRSFYKSDLANQTINLVAKDDGIYKGDAIQVEYKNIYKVEQLEDAIVLYHNLGTTYIPNKAFKNSEQRGKFKKMI